MARNILKLYLPKKTPGCENLIKKELFMEELIDYDYHKQFINMFKPGKYPMPALTHKGQECEKEDRKNVRAPMTPGNENFRYL